MSIESELERLNTAKSNLVTAIQKKGVIVPDLARLDEYDFYVEAIPVHFSNAGCTASMRTDLTVSATDKNPKLAMDTMDDIVCLYGRFENVGTEMVAKGSPSTKITLIRVS